MGLVAAAAERSAEVKLELQLQVTELQFELDDFVQWRCIYRGPPHALKFPLISLFQWGKEVLGRLCLLFCLLTSIQSPCSPMKLT